MTLRRWNPITHGPSFVFQTDGVHIYTAAKVSKLAVGFFFADPEPASIKTL